MLTSPAIKTHVEDLLKEIGDLYPEMKRLSEVLRPMPGTHFRKFNADDWTRHVYEYALKRLLIFESRNFVYIETLGMLALTRYVFELAVWIRLLSKNRDYALVYYSQQIDTMRCYYRDQLAHLDREAALFKQFADEESRQIKHNVEKLGAEPDHEKQLEHAHFFPKEVMRQIDLECAKHFSVMADEAKTNGYGFQAYLIETKTAPLAQKAIHELDAEEAAFRSNVPQSVLDLIPKKNRFNWSDMAQKVSMEHEYKFIYSHTSKLLHATPASITTDHPNLELVEVRTFLRYILFTLREIIDTIKAQHY